MSYSHLDPVVQVQHLEVALQQVTLATVAKGAGGRLQQDLLNSALSERAVCSRRVKCLHKAMANAII